LINRIMSASITYKNVVLVINSSATIQKAVVNFSRKWRDIPLGYVISWNNVEMSH